jgi:hypothetical protein
VICIYFLCFLKILYIHRTQEISLTSWVDGANAATDEARIEQTMTENFMIQVFLYYSKVCRVFNCCDLFGFNCSLISSSLSNLKAIDTGKIASLKHHSGSVKLLKFQKFTDMFECGDLTSARERFVFNRPRMYTGSYSKL